MDIGKFRKMIWKHYEERGRDLPWRPPSLKLRKDKSLDPYKILVSEIMLQQTQVPRVLPKYEAFLKRFPTVESLAKARLLDVLRVWQGLGYNRRAVALKRCAEEIVKDFGGEFPQDFRTLCSLPGIGPATAGDLMVFAWNVPVPVIETNIRSVFIYFFFPRKKKVHDKEILPLVEKTLDRKNPRGWYYALFDYGSHLKKSSNPSRRSAHHAIQSPFEGSHRQKRSRILRVILEKPRSSEELQRTLPYDADLLVKILSALEKEGFIKKTKSGRYAAA